MADIKPWQSALAQGLTQLGPLLDQRRTARRQQDAARQGLEDQRRHQREADARVHETIGDVRQSTPDAERQRANEGFMLALRRARQHTGGSPVPGGSAAYTMDVRHADQGVQGYGQQFANLLAQIDAPQYQRRGEAEGVARLQSDVAGLGRNSAADEWLMRFRQSNRQANPWAPLIAAIAGGAIDGLATRDPGAPADGLTPIDLSTLPKPRTVPINPRDAMLPMPIFNPGMRTP